VALPDDLWQSFEGQEALLSTVCIVSQLDFVEDATRLSNSVDGTAVPGLKVQVEAAGGAKCDRCWMWSQSIGRSPEHPTVCSRCQQALARLAG
jgi:isoleucyl-tRNA synthetase